MEVQEVILFDEIAVCCGCFPSNMGRPYEFQVHSFFEFCSWFGFGLLIFATERGKCLGIGLLIKNFSLTLLIVSDLCDYSSTYIGNSSGMWY